jgi:allantoicase
MAGCCDAMTDLISEAVGGRVVACNDEFFGEAKNLLQTTDPVWREGVYTEAGKWMDGWETRRRRDPGHDWCVIALGIPGAVRSVTVDTSHFTGNYPDSFSIEVCGAGSDDRLASATWEEVIPQTGLAGDSVATFDVDDTRRVTHLRLNIFPDGGVARLRVDGDPIPMMGQVCPEEGRTDLASALVGGVATDASDLHYSPPSNMLRPTEPAGMWDGWETRRRRGPGNDWATFRLGLPGLIETVEVDTRFFRGNSPGWVSIHLSEDGSDWREVIARAEVKADAVNIIDLAEPTHAGHLRLDIHPDGGVARLRVRGTPDRDGAGRLRTLYLNSLFDQEARRFFHTACASASWVEQMMTGRPYPDVESVLALASTAFDTLGEVDWSEAFAGHPRIGERGDPVANAEQAGTAHADETVRAQLAEVNAAYERAHGFTYIVFATGKTAEEMLAIARSRLVNSTEDEMANAAGEQRAITESRLRRMLCMEGAR